MQIVAQVMLIASWDLARESCQECLETSHGVGLIYINIYIQEMSFQQLLALRQSLDWSQARHPHSISGIGFGSSWAKMGYRDPE